MRRLIACAAALALTAGMAACGSGSGSETSSSSDEGPITLGFAIGETGFMEPFDGPAKVAADFAIEDINGEGGADGRKFETTTANTKSKAELSGDAATQVLDDGADIVVTSCDFDQGSPAAIVADKQGVLAFSTCAASTAFGPTGIGPLAFTMATAAPAEGAAMAEWAHDKQHATSAVVLLDDTIEFDKQSAYGFQTRFGDLGGDVSQQTFKQTDQSIASQINAIKSANPDVIYLASYMPGEASAIKQIRAAGITTPILADEDIDGDYWKGGVPGLNDVFFATYASIYGDDPDQKVNELVDRYKAKTGKLPDTSAFLTGYAMVQAIQKAVEGANGSTEGSALQEQLEGFDDEQLLLPTTFDSQYHITLKRSLALMQINDGKTTYMEEWTPDEVPVPKGQ
jgi:branched-chain amino acid transport system substrate-binding protein